MTRKQITEKLVDAGFYAAAGKREDYGYSPLTISRKHGTVTVRDSYFYYGGQVEALTAKVRAAFPSALIEDARRNDHAWPKTSFASVTFRIR